MKETTLRIAHRDVANARRDFLKKIGAGAAAAALTAACSAPGGSRTGSAKTRFRLGLASYTFREFSLDETLEKTIRLGLDRIALKSFHLPMESSIEDIRAAAGRVGEAGLDLYGCGVVYMKNRSEVDRAFAYAAAAKMSMIIGVPDPDMLPAVEQRVKATGIRLAIHNHGPGDEIYPSPDSAWERIRGLDPGIGICLDAGHTARCGIDPSDSALLCADRLLDVHIKDVTAADVSGSTVEIGRGVIDIPGFLRTLVDIAYDGTVSFEFEKDGADPLPGTAESVGYVRGVLDAL
jgi:inosose dehydratase